tara:strand:- start:2379 stop:2981 length:603 start_codon:yes stop_codon:yes gene_type:complete
MTFDQKEYMKEYYQRPEVKERKKEYNKEYRQRPEVKERKRKHDKEYYQRPEVKELRKKYLKEYYQRPEVKERNFKNKINNYRNYGDYFFYVSFIGARHRNTNKLKKPFNITKEYLKEIFPKNRTCPVLGIEFKVNEDTGGKFNSATLDRIDNDKGYEIGNVIWVCKKVNQIKSYSTPDEIIKVGEFYKELEKEHACSSGY